MGEPDRPEHAEVLSDVRARVLVSGRVQGVFYRYTCAREAARERLRGFVHNLHDGRVEAVFQGQKAAVNRLIEWCRVGPPAADVADVSVTWEKPGEDLAAF